MGLSTSLTNHLNANKIIRFEAITFNIRNHFSQMPSEKEHWELTPKRGTAVGFWALIIKRQSETLVNGPIRYIDLESLLHKTGKLLKPLQFKFQFQSITYSGFLGMLIRLIIFFENQRCHGISKKGWAKSLLLSWTLRFHGSTEA